MQCSCRWRQVEVVVAEVHFQSGAGNDTFHQVHLKEIQELQQVHQVQVEVPRQCLAGNPNKNGGAGTPITFLGPLAPLWTIRTKSRKIFCWWRWWLFKWKWRYRWRWNSTKWYYSEYRWWRFCLVQQENRIVVIRFVTGCSHWNFRRKWNRNLWF